MYNGIGLQTVRGSGTNGYVQSNKAFVKAVNVRTAQELNRGGMSKEEDWKARTAPEGNASIVEHARKRAVELKVAELRDEMEDGGASEEMIEEHCEKMRKELLGLERAPPDRNARTDRLDTHATALEKAKADQRYREQFLFEFELFETGCVTLSASTAPPSSRARRL
jgi:serine/arginine repetitive matrix protein 2